VARASMLRLVVGTMAMLEVIAPSLALSVETPGWVPPAAHKVGQLNVAEGSTVAFRACAVAGGAQLLPCTGTVSVPSTGRGPLRVSNTRHRVTVQSDNPPVPGAAK
jgi:hypothetical protein